MAGNSVEVAKATITIIPSLEGAQSSITSQLAGIADSAGVESAGKKTGSKLAKGLATGLGAATAATAAVTAAATQATTAFVNSASGVASYGDEIDKMSQRLGLSYEGFQKWDYVLGQSGVDINSMQTGLKTLTNKLDDAKNGSADAVAMFESLGLSMEEVGNMSREDLLGAVVSGFQGMADSTERAALANDLFGKSGQNLAPLFNSTTEETQALMEAAEKYGMVMSDDAVKASADFQDSLDTMQRTVEGVKNNMMAEFLPGMSSIMTGVADIFAGNGGGMDKIKEGLDSLIQNITKELPKFVEIITGVAEVLISALPDLIPVVVEGIKIVGKALFDNLPVILDAVMDLFNAGVELLGDPEAIDTLIDCALNLVLTLADGLIDALPVLIPAVVQIIFKLVTSLIEHLPDIIATAVKLVGGLVTGLISAIPSVISGTKNIITSILTTLAELPGKLIETALEWGHDLISNFVQGIKDNIGKVTEAVTGVANTIKDFLGFSEPDMGPLSNFHTYAPDMIDLFAEGLEQSKSKLTGTLNTVLTLPDATIPAGAGGGSAITIPVYLGSELLDTVLVNANQRINLMSGGV